MRGWLHAVAAPISLVAGVVLVVAAPGVRWPLGIYTATLVAMFATSALYHRGPWSPAGKQVWRRLDHSTIFIFIAGSYTAYCAIALPTARAATILAVVWVGALIGVGLQVFWPTAPRWFSVPSYAALGWVAVFVLPDLLHYGGILALTMLCVGGGLYSLGAVAYAIRRPNPFPATFGYHEVFHACVVVAAVCHYAGLWFALRF